MAILKLHVGRHDRHLTYIEQIPQAHWVLGATAAITTAGLTVGTVTQVPSTVAAGSASPC